MTVRCARRGPAKKVTARPLHLRKCQTTHHAAPAVRVSRLRLRASSARDAIYKHLETWRTTRETRPSDDRPQEAHRSTPRTRRPSWATRSRPHPPWFSISTYMQILPWLEHHNATHSRALVPHRNHCSALIEAPCADDSGRSHALSLPESRRRGRSAGRVPLYARPQACLT